MASQYHASPPGSIHPQHRPPPAHMPPNGHHPGALAAAQQQPPPPHQQHLQQHQQGGPQHQQHQQHQHQQHAHQQQQHQHQQHAQQQQQQQQHAVQQSQQQPHPSQAGPGQSAAPGQQRSYNHTAETVQVVNEHAWYSAAHCAEVMGLFAEAKEMYQKVLHFNPNNIESLSNMAAILRSEDKFAESAEYLKAVVKMNGSDGEAWSLLGNCYLMMDDLQKAYNAYQSALYNLRNPQEPKLWYGIGILYDRYGSLEHAEEAFSEVMRMAPHFDKANEIYFRLGIIYKQQGKYEESLDCFQYIVRNPPHPLKEYDIMFQIGHVYEHQKDMQAAKYAYQQVLEKDPNHAKVLQQLGWLHHQQDSTYESQESAINYLEQSVSADQSDPQSWYLLGRCYMSQQKYPKAYEAYQQAVYRDGRNPTFWCSIGVLYYQINQFRDALDAYSRAIRLNPNISEVWYDLGTLYESCNNQTNDALDAYQRAAELDPTNEHIQQRLHQLRSGQANGVQHQNGAPAPQDINPAAYQPGPNNAPAPPQWAAQSQGPSTHHQGPSRGQEWPSRDAHAGGPSSQPGLYDQRDAGRGFQAPRAPSPKSEQQYRAQDSQRHTPLQHHQNMSPSPNTRNAMPPYRPGQAGSQGPLPPPPQPHQSQQQGPPARISNPNYSAQPLVPAPPTSAPGQGQHYGRQGSPPSVKPINEARPSASPRSGHSQSRSTSYHQHHADPNAPSSILSGAPVPHSAVNAAETAARDRERDERPGSVPAKRENPYDDRDGSYKRNANDQTRARLDDPHGRRHNATPPGHSQTERARLEAPRSGPPSHAASPDSTRRAEDIRKADEQYRPSEAAHQPQPLSTVVQREEPAQSSPKQKGEQLPPMQTRAEDRQEAPADPPLSPGEQQRREEFAKREQEQRDRESQMKIDEPAARKVEVDENYDEESNDEGGKAGSTKGDSAPAAATSGSGSNLASPKDQPATSAPAAASNGDATSATAEATNGDKMKVEASA